MANAQDPEAQSEEIVVFELSGQHYGLRSSVVREILMAFSPVLLPQAPPTVDGILNVRGETIVLLNLRKRFGLLDKPLAASDHFIIAWEGRRLVALRVDRVLNLRRVPIRSLVDAQRFLSQPELICGVAIIDDKMVVIHDLERFLSLADHELLAKALANQHREPHQ